MTGTGRRSPRHARQVRRSGRARTVIRGVGQTLITLGAVVLLFIVYEVWVTDQINEGVQSELTQDLRQRWDVGEDPLQRPDGGLGQLALGEGFAFIRIPSFGLDYVRVVLEGTDEDKLTEGPGHYPDSALPGEVGNFAMAGHRVGKGSPFLNLDRLEPGEAIIIETSETWYVYRMLDESGADDPDGIPGREIVDPGAIDVVDPVPGEPGAEPTRSLLTLTTCHPKFSAAQRMIIHAELDGAPLSKDDYPDGPPALTGG
ncbi:MAG: class E sortase [Geodermatophilaceae bacterium]|nr:class E sortase [Geodermatophilaceae bacterium]